MPRGKQPSQRAGSRKAKLNQKSLGSMVPAGLPQSQAVVECPVGVTTSNGTTNSLATSVATSLWTSSRFAAFAGIYQQVRVRAVTITPIGLTAAQYVQCAVIWPNLPALLSTTDVIPSAASIAAKLLSQRGALRYQQGCGPIPSIRSVPPTLLRFQAQRVAVDLPWALVLLSYSTADVNWALNFEIEFSDVLPSI